jgi:hypothetical protein
MEKVTVKAENKQYNGSVRGFHFKDGVVHNVPLKDAEIMEEAFGVYIDKPEQPEEKPKAKAKKKSPSKKKGD